MIHKFPLFLLFINSVFSQELEKKYIINEFQISYNKTTYAKSPYEIQNKDGFGLGLYQELNSNKKLHLKIGYEYNYYEYKARFSNFNETPSSHPTESKKNLFYRVHAINIPALFTLNFGKKVRFYFDFGPFISFSFFSKLTYTYTTLKIDYQNLSTETFTEEVNQNYSFIHLLGYTNGLAMMFPVKRHFLVIKGSFQTGLRDYGEFRFHLPNYRVSIGYKL